jgi:hypothetical protein
VRTHQVVVVGLEGLSLEGAVEQLVFREELVRELA